MGKYCRVCAALGFVFLVAPAIGLAQTDEIQVYDAEIAGPGVFNLMIHTNFTPIGRTTPDFPGSIIADHSFQTTAEWAYGVTPWFEQGLYLPVTTPYSQGRGPSVDGFKIRELFVRPNAAEHEFFYGVNFEFSVNATYWERRRISSEVRPIVGTHFHRVDLIFNPIVDTDYQGGLGNLEFVPAARAAYHLNDKWAVAAEWYSDFGPLHDFLPVNDEFHEIWAVTDHEIKGVSIEAGIGFGVTAGADKLTLKLMFSRDLNARPKPAQ